VATCAEAAKAMAKLKVQREENLLPVLKRTPTFAEYSKKYFEFYDTVKDAKRKATLDKERGAIRKWGEHLGHVRLNHITKSLINSFIASRQGDGISGRTVNLDVIALRNVLKKAIDDGWLKSLPTENMRPLKWTPKKRELLPLAQFDKLCEAGLKASKNGSQFVDYIKFMAYTGARRNESLRVRWANVDFEHRQVTIGADGDTKNRETRVVDFNAKLEAHLKDMQARRAPDSQWLFPSPQRGDKDVRNRFYDHSRVGWAPRRWRANRQGLRALGERAPRTHGRKANFWASGFKGGKMSMSKPKKTFVPGEVFYNLRIASEGKVYPEQVRRLHTKLSCYFDVEPMRKVMDSGGPVPKYIEFSTRTLITLFGLKKVQSFDQIENIASKEALNFLEIAIKKGDVSFLRELADYIEKFNKQDKASIIRYWLAAVHYDWGDATSRPAQKEKHTAEWLCEELGKHKNIYLEKAQMCRICKEMGIVVEKENPGRKPEPL
jgi:integrase